ncbi:MAG: serine/threonine protein kinase [Candidatus Obscuribacterales bacterium]|nr:serine/threonine protein kinase [Candidatus Obscuribacterales bacterium]
MLEPGDIWDGKYKIIRHLADGGMGAVYQARQDGVERDVVIKLVHAAVLGDEEMRKRFEREALLTSKIKHPNIVTFFSYGFCQGLPYIVIEYLSGMSLAEYLQESGPLSVQSTTRLFMLVCDALAAAHAQSVVHRDLKPNNIFLCEPATEMFPKVLDFGLAALSDGDAAQRLTATGLLIGSVYYMSPEQCRGQRADARADIYALGCTMYECLCGAPPYTCDSPMGLIYKHLNHELPLMSASDARDESRKALHKVVWKCMQKAPEDRYQSVSELHRDLEQISRGETPSIAESIDVHKKLSPGSLVRVWRSSALMLAILLALGFFLDPGMTPLMVSAVKRISGKPDEEEMKSLVRFLRPFKPKASLELSGDIDGEMSSALLDRLEAELQSVSVDVGQRKYYECSHKLADVSRGLIQAAKAEARKSEAARLAALIRSTDYWCKQLPPEYVVAYRENRNGLSRAVAEQLLVQPALYDLECGLLTYKKDDVAQRSKLLGRFAHAFHEGGSLSGCRAVLGRNRAELSQVGVSELSNLYVHMANDELLLGLDNECIATMRELLALLVKRSSVEKRETLSGGTRDSLWNMTMMLCQRDRRTRPKSDVLSLWFGELLQLSSAANAAKARYSSLPDWALRAFMDGAVAVGRRGDRRENLVVLQTLSVIMSDYAYMSKTSEGQRFASGVTGVVNERFKAEPLVQSLLYGELAMFDQVGGRKMQAKFAASRAADLLSNNKRSDDASGLWQSLAYLSLCLYDATSNESPLAAKLLPKLRIQDLTRAISQMLPKHKPQDVKPVMNAFLRGIQSTPEATSAELSAKYNALVLWIQVMDTPERIEPSLDGALALEKLCSNPFFADATFRRARAKAICAYRLAIGGKAEESVRKFDEAKKLFWSSHFMDRDRVGAGIEIGRFYERNNDDDSLQVVLDEILPPSVVQASSIDSTYMLAFQLLNNWGIRRKNMQAQVTAAACTLKIIRTSGTTAENLNAEIDQWVKELRKSGASAEQLQVLLKIGSQGSPRIKSHADNRR